MICFLFETHDLEIEKKAKCVIHTTEIRQMEICI